MEKTVLTNLINKNPKKVAEVLGINIRTVATYVRRVKAKREVARNFMRETNRYSHILYPKRKGE